MMPVCHMATMNMSADAYTAPACQSASMTDNCAAVLGTAVLVVSFLSGLLLNLGSEAVRIVRMMLWSVGAKP